jgi:hypothetical protein
VSEPKYGDVMAYPAASVTAMLVVQRAKREWEVLILDPGVMFGKAFDWRPGEVRPVILSDVWIEQS